MVAQLSGRVDIMCSHTLQFNLSNAIRNGVKRIVVNMGDVTFMDSSGMSALVASLKEIRRQGGTMVLTKANSFRSMRIDLFETLNSLEYDAPISILRFLRIRFLIPNSNFISSVLVVNPERLAILIVGRLVENPVLSSISPSKSTTSASGRLLASELEPTSKDVPKYDASEYNSKFSFP